MRQYEAYRLILPHDRADVPICEKEKGMIEMLDRNITAHYKGADGSIVTGNINSDRNINLHNIVPVENRHEIFAAVERYIEVWHGLEDALKDIHTAIYSVPDRAGDPTYLQGKAAKEYMWAWTDDLNTKHLRLLDVINEIREGFDPFEGMRWE